MEDREKESRSKLYDTRNPEQEEISDHSEVIAADDDSLISQNAEIAGQEGSNTDSSAPHLTRQHRSLHEMPATPKRQAFPRGSSIRTPTRLLRMLSRMSDTGDTPQLVPRRSASAASQQLDQAQKKLEEEMKRVVSRSPYNPIADFERRMSQLRQSPKRAAVPKYFSFPRARRPRLSEDADYESFSELSYHSDTDFSQLDWNSSVASDTEDSMGNAMDHIEDLSDAQAEADQPMEDTNIAPGAEENINKTIGYVSVTPEAEASVDRAMERLTVAPDVDDNVEHAVEHFNVTPDVDDSFDNAMEQLSVAPDDTEEQTEKEASFPDFPVRLDESPVMETQQTPPREQDDWHDDGLDVVLDSDEQQEPVSSVRRVTSGSTFVRRRLLEKEQGMRSEVPKAAIPKRLSKKLFSTFAKSKVDPDVTAKLLEASDLFFEQLADDLEAYTEVAQRDNVDMSDLCLLLQRQGFIHDKMSLEALAHQYLPRELWDILCTSALSDNMLYPEDPS